MKRLVVLTVLVLATYAIPPLADAASVRQTYRVNTSAPHGMATCAFKATVKDAKGKNLAITISPAAESPTTGENGGEIRITRPFGVSASAGVEEACDAFFPNDDRTGTKRIRKALKTMSIVFQVHSHPDNNCLASGVARGAVTLTVPDPGTVTITDPTCSADESEGNVDAEVVEEPFGVRTDVPGSFGIDVTNQGPGMANGAFFVARFPDTIFILDAAADGVPCRVVTSTTIPPVRTVTCPLGDMAENQSLPIDIVFGAGEAGPFDMVMNANSANGGGLFGPTKVTTPVAQGTAGTLYVTATSSNGGTGSVNISPAGNTGTPHASCATPDGANKEVTCDNSYSGTTTVTLTAKPGAGANVRWGGACSGVPATTMTCTVTVTPPDTINASVRFRIPNP